MHFKKMFLSGIISLSILALGTVPVYGRSFVHTVQAGDTYWIISQKYDVSIDKLMALNNADQDTIIYVGQKVRIPDNSLYQTIHTVIRGETFWIISQKYGIELQTLLEANSTTVNRILYVGDRLIIPTLADVNTGETYYTVQKGDTFWIISQKSGVDINKLMAYNNANNQTILYIGQTIKIPASGSDSSSQDSSQSSQPYITYDNYTVVKGDILWDLAIKFGLPMSEIIEANNSINPDSLVIGDTLKIPVHHIPVKSTPGGKYGELLDWWTEAQYVIPVNADFEVVDFYTGKSFYARRTTGSNHADCEPLTTTDTNKMKEIWGGALSWTSRPVIIKYNGRKIAASASSMAHAGNDASPGGVYTSWRSGDYGAGTNYDWVKNNGVDGHFDIHFLNSTKHVDGEMDPNHQYNVKISAGIK